MPDRPLPPYAYVPGRHPHPVSDPAGHSFGERGQPVEPLDPGHPRDSAEFQYGVALFNHGYYWEAHEVWESLWHAAGRGGPVADLLKGLIKLAAAGVKAREGNAAGVVRHARRAADLFRNIGDERVDCGSLFHSLGGLVLIQRCEELAEHPLVDATPSVGGMPVLGIRIDQRQGM